MVRTCQHHEAYTQSEQVQCKLHGTVDLTACSSCEQFLLKPQPKKQKQATAQTSTPAPQTGFTCIHLGAKRRCCQDLFLCKKFPGESCSPSSTVPGVMQCGTCESFSPIDVTLNWTPAIHASVYKVGFLSAAYMPIGGTETFHRSLVPRLKDVVNIAGFVTTAIFGGDGSKLEVPYATNILSAQKLASHCQTIVAWGIDSLAQILPVNRPKVIVVHHSDWSSEWSNSTILNQLDLIDQVVCVNADTAQQLRNVIDKPVHFIPNAIDPKRIMPSGAHATLRAQHSIPEDAKLLLFGHRLSPEKRPDLAIEIAKLLPDNWFTVIAGDGAEQDKIKADAAATCDRVCVVGAVDSLADWFEVSDCFLSLSTFEGFGLSIGESMAAGLPTVSTATGIAPGLATTLPTDATAQQWADAIVTAKPLVTPEEILERFSVQRMVDSWANVIKKMPVP